METEINAETNYARQPITWGPAAINGSLGERKNTKKCLACNGRGFLIFKDGRQEKCSKCHGTGTISKMLILARKEMEKQKKTCPKCHGTGRIKVKDISNRMIKSEKCLQCKGTGKIKREIKSEVTE